MAVRTFLYAAYAVNPADKSSVHYDKLKKIKSTILFRMGGNKHKALGRHGADSASYPPPCKKKLSDCIYCLSGPLFAIPGERRQIHHLLPIV